METMMAILLAAIVIWVLFVIGFTYIVNREFSVHLGTINQMAQKIRQRGEKIQATLQKADEIQQHVQTKISSLSTAFSGLAATIENIPQKDDRAKDQYDILHYRTSATVLKIERILSSALLHDYSKEYFNHKAILLTPTEMRVEIGKKYDTSQFADYSLSIPMEEIPLTAIFAVSNIPQNSKRMIA